MRSPLALAAVFIALAACQPDPAPPASCTVIQQQADRLELGMTAGAAFAALGCEGQRVYRDRELLNDATIAVYEWRGANNGIGHALVQIDTNGEVVAFSTGLLPNDRSGAFP